jgi:transcriptional regulator with GAF, ATPase, and Fis domain
MDPGDDVKELPQGIASRPALDEMFYPAGLFQSKTSCAPGIESGLLPSSEVLSQAVEPLPGMMGESKAMQAVYRLSRLVSPRSTTVLVTGETGTGKELVARAIHLLSPRQGQPFVTVNCAAIPEALLESELFGYARGAFTGAFQSRMGRIQSAHGGTLFLDEVGELPLSMQAKLLRFLQEGEVQRLGGPDVVRVDVRVIAATNAELSKRVAEKAFREDLYYRLSVFPIDLVPLRERPEDILPLGRHFLEAFCAESGLPAKTISSSAGSLLVRHTWPGNVRELRHVMERAFILSENSTEILTEHIRLQTPWR